MSIVFQLSNDDQDQLKELLNIGASYAGTMLSQMVGHRISISVPSIEVKDAESALHFIDKQDEITLAVLLRITGGIDGYVFLYFPHDATVHLLKKLSGKTITDLRALDPFDRSVFQEIGNVITGGMLSGLSKFLHLISLNVVMCIDAPEGSMLCGSDEQLSGYVFLFFGPETASRILELTRPMVSRS
jgi:chemotaxis protein CheC